MEVYSISHVLKYLPSDVTCLVHQYLSSPPSKVWSTHIIWSRNEYSKQTTGLYVSKREAYRGLIRHLYDMGVLLLNKDDWDAPHNWTDWLRSRDQYDPEDEDYGSHIQFGQRLAQAYEDPYTSFETLDKLLYLTIKTCGCTYFNAGWYYVIEEKHIHI